MAAIQKLLLVSTILELAELQLRDHHFLGDDSLVHETALRGVIVARRGCLIDLAVARNSELGRINACERELVVRNGSTHLVSTGSLIHGLQMSDVV